MVSHGALFETRSPRALTTASPSSFANAPRWGGQNVQDRFGRTAKLHALRRDDNRAIDKDGMRHHRIDQLVIAQSGIIQPQLVVRRALPAQHIAHRNPHALMRLTSSSRLGGFFRYSMTTGSSPLLRISPRGVARGAAGRVVIDRDVMASPFLAASGIGWRFRLGCAARGLRSFRDAARAAPRSDRAEIGAIAVDRAFAGGQEGFPRDALRVRDPRFFRLRVATGGRALFQHRPVCPL